MEMADEKGLRYVKQKADFGSFAFARLPKGRQETLRLLALRVMEHPHSRRKQAEIADGAASIFTYSELRILASWLDNASLNHLGNLNGTSKAVLGMAKQMRREAISRCQKAAKEGDFTQLADAADLAIRSESFRALEVLSEYHAQSVSGAVKHILNKAWYAHFVMKNGGIEIKVSQNPDDHGGGC